MKKKTKRILAIGGAMLLAGLYIATFIFALIDSKWAFDMFRVCVILTIVVPVLLYAYTLVYRLQNKDKKDGEDKHEKIRP